MVSPVVSMLLQDVAQLAAELAGKPFTGEERITYKLTCQVSRCPGVLVCWMRNQYDISGEKYLKHIQHNGV